MFHTYRKLLRLTTVLTLAIIITACFGCGLSEAKTKKPKVPPYRPSGVIPGTDLKYERMFIDSNGVVKITILNTKNMGVSFTSNFSFYNSKNQYLTGFVVEGFSTAAGRATYTLELEDFKAYKKAAVMKVLGRSGRMGKTPVDDDTAASYNEDEEDEDSEE